MFEEIVTELRLSTSDLEDIKGSKAPKEQYCPYFEVCGGCQLLTWPYEKQVEWKKNQLKEVFKLKEDVEFISADQVTEYRHKNSISFKQHHTQSLRVFINLSHINSSISITVLSNTQSQRRFS